MKKQTTEGEKQMKKLLSSVLCLLFVFLCQASFAADEKKEIDELKSRLDVLENRVKDAEVVDELGHKLHPIHSLYGLKISGSLTVSAHGVNHIKGDAKQKGAATISADITIESPVGRDGRAVVVLDYEQGAGIQNLPAFFTGPNGNPTGYNADIESFDDNSVHLTQVYYEHNITPSLAASVGKLDITGYFDANDFANNERTQFLATIFVNNPAIEFGGSADFYGPGVRVTWFPVENIDISLGAFEGDGDFTDTFDKPFLMAELNFNFKPLDKNGNYRFYYWDRQGRPDVTNTANPNDPELARAENKGFGFSIDQSITDTVGVWLRAGAQREKVAQFDRHISGGLSITGESYGRANDSIGLAYGATFMGKDYKDFKETSSPGFKAGTEHYTELYYSYAISHAEPDRGFHITPDLQYVVNPGGDKDASKLLIYGIRLQAFF
ncbi:MAG: carbohydrate porin [Deltaproteobacteria bacterium]|nr:carbohydrate porin [Deltaproteobacteria bacterium]